MLVKKLDSHSKIIDQIAKQTVAAKQFRNTVIETFGALEKGSVLSAFIWSTLCGQKFNDSCLEVIKSEQLVEVEAQLAYLGTVSENLKLLNEEAIKDIENNLKNIVDGGSKDLQDAMKKFSELQDAMTAMDK